jgi:ubiquinol-cytochrome c reductase cytochrome b subunit
VVGGAALVSPHDRATRDPLRFIDERMSTNRLLRKALRYVFPDHWSFMLGEVALYAFLVLIATGTFLAFFFEPSLATMRYSGPFAALRGHEVSAAYNSTLAISSTVPAGLLIRQAHHWAADVFVVAIVLHLVRIFFTGAFRKPRELNYLIGVTMLMLAVLEGFLGYSLVDDLLSGMGLAIAYAVAMSIPFFGGDLAHLIWGGEFPGADAIQSRLYIGHVFLLPAVLAALITVHLAIVVRQRHSQFRGPAEREDNVVGTPMWPGYALRSTGLLLLVAAVLFALAGLAQINPIWEWGPYEPWQGTNGAQPDWYLGWLIGALRIMPSVEIAIGGWTLVPNPFFGGVLFPLVVFGVLYAWPWLEQRFITRDFDRHDLLDRPRDNPRRTAVGAAFFSWVVTVFAAGAADRVFLILGVDYVTQVWIFRAAVFVVPVVVYVVAGRVARELQRTESHPLRGWGGVVLRRTPSGGFAPAEPERESLNDTQLQ